MSLLANETEILVSVSFEMSRSVLPISEINDHKTLEIRGTYFVELKEIFDAAIPKAKEDDFLTIEEEEKIGNSKADDLKKNKKKTQLHVLLVSDNSKNVVKCMEYEKIPCLSIDIPQGTRLCLKGPIEISFRVLLLRNINIQILKE